MDSYKMKFFWIDDTYDDKGYNKATYESLSKSEFLDLKPFKKLGPAIEEIKKLDFEIIFVLIKASLYQELRKRRRTGQAPAGSVQGQCRGNRDRYGPDP